MRKILEKYYYYNLYKYRMRVFDRKRLCGGRMIKVRDVKKIDNVDKLKKVLQNINISGGEVKEPKKCFKL